MIRGLDRQRARRPLGPAGHDHPLQDGDRCRVTRRQGNLVIDMSTDGDGLSVIDLDAGVLRSSVMHTTVRGTISGAAAAPAQVPNMTIRGTMKATITSTSTQSSAGT